MTTTVPDTEPDRFDAAYARLRPTLVRVAFLLTSDAQEASDLVQDAFLAALGRWDAIEDHDAYLRQAVTNRAYNATRNRSRRADKAIRAAYERGSAADPGEPEYLGDLIAALPPRQRAVVVLRFYLDLSYDEIAASLGLRPGSVDPTLSRALAALDQELRS